MNTEDDEFERIEREAKARMMAMFAQLPETIPFITREQLQELFKDTNETKQTQPNP
jgi:hypothetical protein